MTARRRTAVLISGGGTNLQALIDAQAADPTFPAEIALVLSNRAKAFGLERAQQAGIATDVISHRGFESREAFDAVVHERLEAEKIDFVCLAGFDRIFAEEMPRRWAGRMLNIHPSLLPAFRGWRAHEQVIESDVALSGCTVFSVTPEVDGGPTVAQAAVPRLDTDTVEALGARVLAAEHALYPFAIRAFLRDGDRPLPALPQAPQTVFGVNGRVRYGHGGNLSGPDAE